MIETERSGDELPLEVYDFSIFTNYFGLRQRLLAVDADVRRVGVNFAKPSVVDHTVLDNLHKTADKWTERHSVLGCLQAHESMSNHQLVGPKKKRAVAV